MARVWEQRLSRPTRSLVLFIHGIRNANKNNPYSFTRRTGVAIDIDNPFHPIFMDARNIIPPFTSGALRGGTHAHTWSGDGKWISFTYNDYIMEQLAKTDSSVKDLRTVGVMVPGHAVNVPIDSAGENNNGEMFAVVVAKVTEKPARAVMKSAKLLMKDGLELTDIKRVTEAGSNVLLLSRVK